jgi:hypothetical protein
MVVELGISDLQMMHFGRGTVGFLNEGPDQAAGFHPGLHIRKLASDQFHG